MAGTDKHSIKTSSADAEPIKLKGKYIQTIGRRKTATAQIRLYKSGSGLITVNGLKVEQYFKEEDLLSILSQPLKLTGLAKEFNISVMVFGGGRKSQAEAVRHGIARGLLEVNPELRP